MTAENLANLHVIPRAAGGKFAKGGPGRPVGAKGKANLQALETIKSYAPAALQALHDAIVAKERWAVEYTLNKVLPHNGRLVEFENVSVEDMTEALRAWDITISEFNNSICGIEKSIQIDEVTKLLEKVEELECLVRDAK